LELSDVKKENKMALEVVTPVVGSSVLIKKLVGNANNELYLVAEDVVMNLVFVFDDNCHGLVEDMDHISYHVKFDELEYVSNSPKYNFVCPRAEEVQW